MHNNLKRVKGILSARQGTQVPKFQHSGKLLTKQLQQGTIYSQDGQNWFMDETFQTPYSDTGSAEFLMAAQQEIIPEPSSVTGPSINLNTNSVTIPGRNPAEGNPTAFVENAGQQADLEQNIDLTKKAQRQQRIKELNEQGIVWQKKDINTDTGITDKQQERIDRIAANGPRGAERAERVKQRMQDRNTLTLEENQQNLDTANKLMSGSISALGSAFKASNQANNSNTTNMIDTGTQAVSSTLSEMGGTAGTIGKIIGIADSAGQIIRGITGGTDQMTGADKFFDSGIGTILGGFINQIGAQKSDAFATDVEALETVGSSYGGTAADISEAAKNADKKYGLFSSNARRKANEAAKKVATTQNIMSNVADTARDQRLAVQSMGEQAGLAYSMMTDGGYNQKYTYAAKHGGLLEWNPVIELEWQPQVELNWELPTLKEGGSIDFVEELEWIPEFKSGGKTEETDIPETEETTQKNVIPEGALHKNKHHMEHAEGLTKKGIPVVDEDGEQQAEIEHSEIIFTLEVTKKLEEYYEIFYSEESTNKEKEQAALDAGKLLVYQILENTEDRTGLIESCKKGGTLTFKKDTEELIEEVLEWMPTVVIVETEEPKKESKKEKLEVSKKDTKDEIKDMIKEVLIELLVK